MKALNLKERISAFVQSRSKNTIERHQVIIYLIHCTIVILVLSIQFLGLGGSQKWLPLTMSAIHFVTCLSVLTLWLLKKMSIPMAFSIVALVAQLSVIGRYAYFALVRPEQYLQLIILNQITSLLAVVFLVISFVKYTPFIVASITLAAYAATILHLQEPSLWQFFFFFTVIEFFLCVLGEMLRRNVRHVQTENTDLHHRETALMHAVRLNEREIESYLRMTSNDAPTLEDTDRFFAMLRPKSQRNIINAVRLHVSSHLMDDNDLPQLFPMLTKSELDVCNLILQNKKMTEISQLLEKTEKNVGVVRAHIRKKLGVPAEQDLRKHLMELVLEKRQQRTSR